jgi:hypothetical protein
MFYKTSKKVALSNFRRETFAEIIDIFWQQPAIKV